MKTLFLLLFMVILLFYRREGFTTTGIKINPTFNLQEYLTLIHDNDVKYIVIVPYPIGMNKLQLLVDKVRQMGPTEKMFFFVVENKELADDFFSKIYSTPLSFDTPIATLLVKNTNPKINSMYVASTNTLLQHKINKVLQKINK